MGTPDILIAGGGIGGMVAARALQLAGYDPLVVEQAPALGDVGAGVTLGPNACKALRSIGLLEAVLKVADRPQRHSVRHYLTAEQTDAFEAGTVIEARYGGPFLQVHRSDLHAVLANAVITHATSGGVRLGRRLTALEVFEDGARAAFADGEVMEAELLVGADGLRSVARSAVVGDLHPAFAGFVAWRSVIPADVLPVSLLEPGSVLYLGPGRSLLRYFVRGGTMVNCVAFAERSEWTAEGWSIEARPGDLSREFDGWCGEVQSIISAMEASSSYQWGLFGRLAPATWVKDRVVLLGDAAHPMLPFLGQGATMAIEDGIILGRCMADSIDIDDALRRYQRTRFDRVNWIVQNADAQGLRMHGRVSTSSEQFVQDDDSFTPFEYDASTAALAA